MARGRRFFVGQIGIPVEEEEPRPEGSVLFASPLGELEEHVHTFNDPSSGANYTEGEHCRGVKPAQSNWPGAPYPTDTPKWKREACGEEEEDADDGY